jgi:hypothetical protein
MPTIVSSGDNIDATIGCFVELTNSSVILFAQLSPESIRTAPAPLRYDFFLGFVRLKAAIKRFNRSLIAPDQFAAKRPKFFLTSDDLHAFSYSFAAQCLFGQRDELILFCQADHGAFFPICSNAAGRFASGL